MVLHMPVVPPERVRTTARDADSKGQALLENLRRLRNESIIDRAARDMAHAKIRALSVVPNLVVDEGDRLVCFFRLATPLRNDPAFAAGLFESSPLVSLMHRLSTRMGQSADWAHQPQTFLADLPGVQRDDIRLG